MTMRRRPWRPLAGLAAVLLGAVVGGLGFASPASAHAILISSSPTQGSIVQRAPTQVVLTFTEGVTIVAGKVRVVAPDNSRADTGQSRTSGDEVIIPLKPGGQRGTYLVSFRVISADSHPVGGAFTYSVIVTSTPPVETGEAGATSTAVSILFPMVRWLGYAGLIMMVGAVLVLSLLWPQRLSTTGPTRVVWFGAALVAAATIAELIVQVPYVAGGFSQVTSSDVQEVLSSQYGAAHLIRLGVLAASIFLLRPIVRGKGWGADRVLLAVLGAIGVATWSVSGHPYASPVPTVTVASDMIHIAAMSTWIGGLGMLAFFLLPRANATELGAIVPVWSRWAAYAVSALLITGIAQALVEVGSIPALFDTSYGLIVLAKAVLLGAVLIVAAFSRRMVGPIVKREDGAARRLRMLVAAESAGAVVIIGLASVLVQTTPARTPQASAAIPTVQSAVLAAPSGLFTLTVDDSPAKVGANDIHMYATTKDGQPADIKQWTVTAALPTEGVEPISVSVLTIGPDHAIGQVTLLPAGTWTFRFTLRTTEIDEDTVSTTFTIAN